MSEQKRCGTCRHFTEIGDPPGGGPCAIASSFGIGCLTFTHFGTDCPGWSSRFELDRLHDAIAALPDIPRQKIIEICRKSGDRWCFCGVHLSETQT